MEGNPEKTTGWRHVLNVPTAVATLLGALVGLAAFACPQISNYFNRESHTTVYFGTATDTGITVTALNSGRKPSVVRSVVLRFDGEAPVPETELELNAGNNVVPPGASTSLNLTARGFRFDRNIDNNNLATWLETKSPHAILEYEVIESDGRVAQQQQIAAVRLDRFLGRHCCEGAER